MIDLKQIPTLKTLIQEAIEHATQHGATGAAACLGLHAGLSVDVRLGAVETVEHHDDRQFDITVYCGKRYGAASTTDTRPESIRQTVEKACRLAAITEEDACAGLPDPADLADTLPKDLSLYHPWDITPEAAIERAIACEALALQAHPLINNSEGSSVATGAGLRVYGNSHGFLQSFAHTRHSIQCSVVAEKNGQMQHDYSYSVARAPDDLTDIQQVASDAVGRTIAKLSPQKLSTREAPVLFAAEVATSLIRHLLQAIDGNALYRESSFLLNQLGQPIFPKQIEIVEDPFILRGFGSCPYDAEGVKVAPRSLIHEGVLQGYLLDSYAARQLKMRTTGNAGGAHNIVVTPTHGNFKEMLQLLGTGLLVMEVMGQGVNIVSGDYSRGFAGFWVEGGKIQFPVEEMTIASNLRDMFTGVVGVGADIDKRSSVHCGSVLIDRMQVGGV